MSGCDPEFGQFDAHWHIWLSMGSCHQGQISFLFDGHGVVFSSLSIENLISKTMIPHNYAIPSNVRKGRYFGLNSSRLTWESMGIIIGGVCPIHSYCVTYYVCTLYYHVDTVLHFTNYILRQQIFTYLLHFT